jgi:hypothetical protein
MFCFQTLVVKITSDFTRKRDQTGRKISWSIVHPYCNNFVAEGDPFCLTIGLVYE